MHAKLGSVPPLQVSNKIEDLGGVRIEHVQMLAGDGEWYSEAVTNWPIVIPWYLHFNYVLGNT